MGGFFDFFASVGLSIWMVLTLDSDAAQWFRVHPLSVEISLVVAALAGISTLLGNSVVLFLNRVRGWRFVVTLALNGAAMVLLYAAQALVIAIVGPLVLGHSPGLVAVIRAVMLSTAPLVFGFLVLIPYLGPAIGRVLQAWGLLVLWVLVDAAFGATLWQAFVITAIGWGVMQLLSWALSRPISWIGNGIWRMITGKPAMMTGTDLLTGDFFLPLAQRFDPTEVK